MKQELIAEFKKLGQSFSGWAVIAFIAYTILYFTVEAFYTVIDFVKVVILG